MGRRPQRTARHLRRAAPFAVDGTPGQAVALAAPSSSYRHHPAVTFTGQHYLVVWGDCPDGNNYKCPIRGRLVGTAGDLVGDVFDLPNSTSEPPYVLASGSTHALVVAQRAVFPKRSLLGFPIPLADPGSAGQPIELAEITTMRSHDVAWDGQNFICLWGQEDIHALTIDPAGQPIGPPFVFTEPSDSVQQDPTIACNGTSCAALWQQALTKGPDGARFDTTNFAGFEFLEVESPGSNKYVLDLVFDGNRFLATWSDGQLYDGDYPLELHLSDIDDPGSDPLDMEVEPWIEPARLATAGQGHLAVVYGAYHFEAPYGRWRAQVRVDMAEGIDDTGDASDTGDTGDDTGDSGDDTTASASNTTADPGDTSDVTAPDDPTPTSDPTPTGGVTPTGTGETDANSETGDAPETGEGGCSCDSRTSSTPALGILLVLLRRRRA